MTQKYASWSSDDTRDTSSLPSDFDAAITAATFTKEPPDNYTAEGNPIFAVITFKREDLTGDEATVIQSYNLGGKAGDEFTISSDGYGLIPTGDEFSAIRKGSKFDLFKCSLENEGVSKSVTGAGSLQAFIGLKAHWRRVEDAKLLGKAREFGDDKRKSKFPPQTLVCVKLISMPGEKGKGATTTASAPASNGHATEGDLDTLAGQYLLEVIGLAKDKQIQRSQITLLLQKAIEKANPGPQNRRVEICKRAVEEEFLLGLAASGIIAYDPAARPQYIREG